MNAALDRSLSAQNRELRQRIEALEIENEILRERLQAWLDGPVPLPADWALTPYQERLLKFLLSRDQATKMQIFDALYGLHPNGGPDPKIVDVLVHHIRKKLQAAGVDWLHVSTLWGRGYAIPKRADVIRRIAQLSQPEATG